MKHNQDIKCIVIGASAGGFQVLNYLFSHLPATFSKPIVMVQHLSRVSANSYIPTLDNACKLPIIEAKDKMVIMPGQIYVAPPDYHLLVEEDRTLSIGLFEPVCYSRPSVDVLFESAAEVYKHNLLGIILSGANSDGALGLKVVYQHQGICIVQDPIHSEFKRMPESAIKETKVDYILSKEEILKFLLSL